ncbi:MAG TPA: hypothetical protein VMF87_06530 [Streptosporangiaceae bacterium]|nr:hypothetical protein [Streptosporangiaceae bacterium]
MNIAALRRAAARTAVPATLAAAAIAAVTGCSSHGSPNALITPPPATTSPSQPAGAATAPAPAATVAASPAPAATSSPQTQSPQNPPPAPPLPAGLTTKITILGTSTGLVPGGKAVKFTVTVTNSSTHPYGNILPLVSLGHCSCTSNSLFPAGTLQERESTSNVWQTIPYDVEGFGSDYLNVTEPGGIQELSPGGVATFEYRVFLSPATSAQVTHGTGSIDVTLLPLPSHTPIGQSPAASQPVDVQSGQPPA